MPERTIVRVLIAEDHAGVRAALRSALATAGGIQVVGEAADGDEALRLVDSLSPDALLLDLGLPVMDGFAVARALAARPARPWIVVLTADGSAAARQAAALAGADRFLVKGADLAALLEALHGVQSRALRPR